MLDSQSKVCSNKQIAKNIYSLEFESTPELFRSKPGQFVNIKVRGENSPFFRRPFSIAGADAERTNIIYDVVGKGTWYLSNLEAGDHLNVIGPFGNGFKLNEKHKRVLLVGGGIGLPPLLNLKETLFSEGIIPTLLIGAKSRNQIYHQHDACPTLFATDDGSYGHNGFVSDLLQLELEQEKFDVIYTCGPQGMLAKVAEIAENHNVECQVAVETLFGCGLGICQGCIVNLSLTGLTRYGKKYLLACHDGPVFNARDLSL